MKGQGETRKGSDGRKIFHRLVTIEEALDMLQKNVVLVAERETVAAVNGRGRVLSESVFSAVDLPPFDRAEMDGYAVIAQDLEGASEKVPVRLRLACSIEAGDQALNSIGIGECAEIATGAPLPRGADSVVMVEYTARRGECVEISRAVTPGENVASTGTDVQIGEMILRGGTLLGTREMGVLAAVGARDIRVVKKPRVGIISTGDELADPGESLGFGKVYDVNSVSISAAVEEAGGIPFLLGRAGDNYDSLRSLVEKGLAEGDMLLLSGGTSAGIGDLVYRILGEMCTPGILAHGINAKPGKPTIIAANRGKPVIGLPGYPVSALIIFDQIVRPFLEKLGGRAMSTRRVSRGRLAFRVNGAKGKRWFLPVHLIKREAGNVAYPILSSSGAIGTLEKADGYVVIGEDLEFVDGGEDVEVNLFVETSADLNIMGSHCPGLDLLLQLLYVKERITAKTANVGSQAGIEAVARGEADIAGIHLLDEATLRYNEAFVLRAGLPRSSLVKGYRRLQGLIVAKGNPKGIKGMEDVLRGDLIFVNRNRGSGTRVLAEHLLRPMAREGGLELGELVKGINGFRWEAKTHSAVAAAVRQGRADLGIGVKSVASAYGLDFIPIGYEEYDFVVSPQVLEGRAVTTFLRYLHSDLFRDALVRLPGYTM